MGRKAIVSVFALAAAIVCVVAPIQGFNPQPDPPGRWGMVGITPYETGRLNVVTNDPGAGQGCAIALGFADSNGRTIRVESRILRTGRAQYLDMMGTEAVPAGETRAEIQPYLLDLADSRAFPPDPCKSVMATFELFDRATGKTSIVFPAVQRAAKGN